jgi:hypothetical protein
MMLQQGLHTATRKALHLQNEKHILAYIPADSLEYLLSGCGKSFHLGLTLAARQQHKPSLAQCSFRTTEVPF